MEAYSAKASLERSSGRMAASPIFQGCAFDDLQIPPSAPRTIVAIIGENENGILRSISQDFMDLLKPYGFDGHIVNLHDANWADRLRGLLEHGVLFAWGPAGIGARLQPGDVPLWDAIKVPFISVMSDSPCWMPKNHFVASDFVANGYIYQDWLHFQKRFVRSPQISSLLPHGVIANPKRDDVAWSHRPHRMVFVKTGCDPEQHRAKWMWLPQRHRAVLEDAGRKALSQGVGDITEVLLQAVDHHGLHLGGRLDILFGLMRELDVYIRDSRSTTMVRSLLSLPVDIIGRGWDHVAAPGSTARFHKAVDAVMLPALYANTQFLLNTMPNFSKGTHERVPSGFAAKCCVITNENENMRSCFGKIPSYISVDTRKDDLSDQIAQIYFSSISYEDKLDHALETTKNDFSAEKFMYALIKFAMEIHYAPNYAVFKF